MIKILRLIAAKLIEQYLFLLMVDHFRSSGGVHHVDVAPCVCSPCVCHFVYMSPHVYVLRMYAAPCICCSMCMSAYAHVLRVYVLHVYVPSCVCPLVRMFPYAHVPCMYVPSCVCPLRVSPLVRMSAVCMSLYMYVLLCVLKGMMGKVAWLLDYLMYLDGGDDLLYTKTSYVLLYLETGKRPFHLIMTPEFQLCACPHSPG